MPELTHITLKVFKSIKELNLGLGPVNVLIGPHGAGRSNFMSFFRMLRDLVEGHLQLFIGRSGGANALLHHGTKVTNCINTELYFGRGGYEIQLTPTEDDSLVFGKEVLHLTHLPESSFREALGSGHEEALAPGQYGESMSGVHKDVVTTLGTWKVYHVHDTSSMARSRQACNCVFQRFGRPSSSVLGGPVPAFWAAQFQRLGGPVPAF